MARRKLVFKQGLFSGGALKIRKLEKKELAPYFFFLPVSIN
jgi:hypothetical protein